jgi:hypothetical protein
MISEDLGKKRSRTRAVAAFSPGGSGTYDRRKGRFAGVRGRAALAVFGVALLLMPVSSPAQLVGAGGVGLLGMGPGWYVGAQRVTSFLVSRAGVTEVANVALSATIRGGLAGAVIMGMIVAEPLFMSGVDSIRTYMNQIGYTVIGGSLYKPGIATNNGPDQFIAGSQGMTDYNACMAGAATHYGTEAPAGASIYNSASDAQTAEGTWYSAGGGYNAGLRENWSNSSGSVQCSYGLVLNPSTLAWVSTLAWCGPTTAGQYVQPNNSQPPPVAATITDLTNKITTDITNAVPAATAAADEAEDILHKGIPGVLNPAATPKVTDNTSAPPTTGAVVDTTIPATPTTGATTPGAEAVNVATANLPSSGAITSTPPAAGTSSADAQQQPYTDPAYSGSLTTVPWATANDFGARWNTFASGVQSTGLFGLWGNAFGSPGSGGGSTYTFNAGSLGTHTYDFSSWGSTVFGLLSGLVQITCGFVAVKIATIKGG